MKLLLTLILLNLSCNVCFAQSVSIDSLLNNSNLTLNVIDSCGNELFLSKETTYKLSFYNFNSNKNKKNKFDRYLKRKGYYTGLFYLISGEQKKDSNNWCNIKGYYKVLNKSIVLNWDDNFSVQEHFGRYNKKLSLWYLNALNSSGEVLIVNSSSIIFKMKQTNYKKDSICISIKMNFN